MKILLLNAGSSILVIATREDLTMLQEVMQVLGVK
jgi:hypothetical protein